MMSIFKTASVGDVPRSVRVKSLRKRTATVVGTFLVATAVGLVGAPGATAAAATGDCNGHHPGCCYQSPI